LLRDIPLVAASPYSAQRKLDVSVLVTVAAGPVVTVGKPERFWRRLFQAAVEIIKRKLPKASFVDFHGCASFHRLPLFFFGSFFFLSEFPLWETRPNRVTNQPADCFNGFRRLSNAIRTQRAATYAQMMSFEDSTIRIMGTLFR